MLPTFLVIGAMKSGTTSLYEYLNGHPHVLMTKKKELDFFVDELNYGRGLGWYKQQFADADNQTIAAGEASTSYTKYPVFQNVPRRIAETIPAARLVYLVRDPIERMRSHYLHEVLLGEEDRPIEAALLGDPRYRAFSNYALQLSQYLEYFPRGQLLVVQAEHMRNDRDATVRQIFEFIGVPAMGTTPDLTNEYHETSNKRVPRPFVRRIMSSSTYVRLSPLIPRRIKRFGRERLEHGIPADRGKMSEDLRARLTEMIRDDVLALRQLWGPQVDGWGLA